MTEEDFFDEVSYVHYICNIYIDDECVTTAIFYVENKDYAMYAYGKEEWVVLGDSATLTPEVYYYYNDDKVVFDDSFTFEWYKLSWMIITW